MTQYLDSTVITAKLHSLQKRHKSNQKHLSSLIREDYTSTKKQCEQLQTILLEIEKDCMALYGKQSAICEHLHSQLAEIQEEPAQKFAILRKDCLHVRNVTVTMIADAVERFRVEADAPVSDEVLSLLERLKQVIEE